jgi:hypothetical protein
MVKPSLVLYATRCILVMAALCLMQKATAQIVLHDEKMGFTPHEFYIADVRDERNDPATVATLINKDAVHIQQLNLKGGAARATKQFIYHNLDRDTLLRPVIVTIKQFKLSESALPGGQVSGRFDIMFSFDLQLQFRTVHLTDYKGGLNYSRSSNKAIETEPILRQGIKDALYDFNTWIDQQADHNVVLAKSVKIKFTDYTEKPEEDTIYYSADRLLTWNDFREKPSGSKFEAEVFAGIGYTEQAEVKMGIINIKIAVKVYVPKSDCLVESGYRYDYVLNHEQRHFDIEKLVGERFKQKIQAMHLTVDNFDGPINVEYLETLREATRMQKQYDSETRHGSDHGAQVRWDEKIDNELRAYGVK